MAVTFKRFDALDKSFNLPMTSVKDSDPAAILNTNYNSVIEVSSDISGFIKNAVGDLSLDSLRKEAQAAYSGVKSALGLDQMNAAFASISNSDLVREGRGLYKSVMDLTKLTPGAIESYISGIFSEDPAIKSAFRSLAASCRNNSLSNVTLGRVSDKKVSCDASSGSSSNKSCDVANVNQIFNKLSGGTYSSVVQDTNLLLKRLSTLANLGYDMNLCGVLGAVANSATGILPKLTAIVLLEQATKGNTSAVMDISKTVAATDNTPLVQTPYVLTEAFENFTIPASITDSQTPALSAGYLAAMDTYNPSWYLADDGVNLSTATMGTTNDAFVSVMTAGTMNHAVDESNLDFVDYDDNTFLCSAYQGNNTASLAELNALA